MSKSLLNLLKVSPAILGASVLMASGAYAAQSPEAVAIRSEQNTTEVSNTNISAIPAPLELSAIPVAVAPEATTTALNLPTAPLTLNNAAPVNAAPVQLPQLAAPVSSGTPSFSANATPTGDGELLRQLNRYSNEGEVNSQVTNISQLRDVSPRDWAFEALRNLVERYQCIAGYPDGTFQGNRPMTRFEFAAGLNACLRRIEALIGGGNTSQVTRQDLEAIRRLTTEFRTELTALGTRVNALEGRVRFLEERQFSTTTKLAGEVVMQLSQTFNGNLNVNVGGRSVALGSNSNVTFGDRVRLNFNTSFTGRDLLNTRLQARNLIPFTGRTGTQNTNLNVEGSENNAFSLGRLMYQFTAGVPLTGIAGTFTVGTTGMFLDDIALNLNPTGDAISSFGANRPIYNMINPAGGAGVSFNALNNTFRFDLAYLVPSIGQGAINNPNPNNGLFGGTYAAMGQITYAPANSIFQGAFTYVNSYGNNDASATTGTLLSGFPFGVNADNIYKETINSYQLQANLQFSPQIVLGSFVNYSGIIRETARFQKADVWSYGLNLAIRDVGSPGSTLGFVFGVPPVARRVQLGGGATVSNSATPYHAEVFYKFNINDNIDVTPGLFAVFRPDGDINRNTVYVGTVRTTFRF